MDQVKISKSKAIEIVRRMIWQKEQIHEAIRTGKSSESLKEKGIRLATPI